MKLSFWGCLFCFPSFLVLEVRVSECCECSIYSQEEVAEEEEELETTSHPTRNHTYTYIDGKLESPMTDCLFVLVIGHWR